ncbi:MAG: hypothetical protein HOV80_19270 [Polyangiaceae bacterium]|nr:hypothetical protein [Polyangiaceae bacterium]
MRTRPTPALLLPFLGLACTLVIDKDRFDDGTTAGLGGGGAAPIATSAETTTTTTSSSSTGISGTCVPSLFHVGFEEPVETWENVLFQSGASAGEAISAPTRRGDAAWRIALSETQKYVLLRSSAPDEEGVSYWMGWSQIHEGPSITYGTRLFDVICSQNADPYEIKIFALELDPTTPNLPYRAWGVAPELNEEGGGTGINTLDDIPAGSDAAFHDWAAHMKLSHQEDGFFELYHEGQLVFSAHGPTLTDECSTTIFARWGLYRWQGWGDGGADMAPAQSTTIDEITLLKGPDAPNTDADALYTLDPDSGCR